MKPADRVLTQRHFHRDHMLTCTAFPMDDGTHQARVVITSLGGLRTRSQRFLDLECHPNEMDALARALAAGIEWVEQQE